jgi:uncharacterized protein
VDCMKAIKALGLLSIIILDLSCGPSKPASVFEGEQAFAKKDYAAALKVFRPLANQGNPVAQSYVGFLYETGKGVPQDHGEAIRWYRLAAEQGNTTAQYNLGGMYENSQGIRQDDAEAIRWYRKAAEQGYSDAQLKLGNRYFGGQGVPQNYKEAAKWVRLAADRGNPEAQLLLGLIYEDGGRGLTQDRVQAHVWYNLAGASGNFEGVKNRDLIAQELTPVQLAEAQRLALEWKPTTGKVKSASDAPAIDYAALARQAGEVPAATTNS